MSAPTSIAATDAPQGRSAAIEALRFVSALAIVYFHMQLPHGPVALAALHSFTILFGYFSLRGSPARAARRLLTPWLVWSAFYVALQIGRAAVQGGWDGAAGAMDSFGWRDLLIGGMLHLWFLPFAFGVACIGRALPVRFWLIGLAALGLTGVAAANLIACAEPFAQWASVAPAAALGLAMARASRPAALCAGFVLGMGALFLLGVEESTLQAALGALAVLAALSAPHWRSAAADHLGRLSFGVYLAHPLAIALTHRLPLEGDATVFAVAALLCVAIAELALRVAPRIV